jgi:hypothetical protein
VTQAEQPGFEKSEKPTYRKKRRVNKEIVVYRKMIYTTESSKEEILNGVGILEPMMSVPFLKIPKLHDT